MLLITAEARSYPRQTADNKRTDNDHWRCLKNGDRLDDLLLVHLAARLVDIAHNVCHAGLQLSSTSVKKRSKRKEQLRGIVGDSD